MTIGISVNGESRVPPGFRFHPTEEELLHYYLRKKVSNEPIDLDVIKDIDLNSFEPWDIQEMCKIGSSSTPQNDWYIFSHKDKKYPSSTRTNRATAAGFWKATGRDKLIHTNNKPIGMRKTLVFYKGRAPNGHKSDWIMHEYRLLDHHHHNNNIHTHYHVASTMQDEGWVVCRIFKKKNHYKNVDDSSPNISSCEGTVLTEKVTMDSSYNNEGTLEQILHQINGRLCKEEEDDDELKIKNEANINITSDNDDEHMKQLEYFINDDSMMAFDDVLHPILASSSLSSAINTEGCDSQVDFWSFPESIFLSPDDPLCLTS